jgi:hypothetical protein
MADLWLPRLMDSVLVRASNSFCDEILFTGGDFVSVIVYSVYHHFNILGRRSFALDTLALPT